jgi:NAD(P)-dependent dehydrogenase (short-subunit alcohol dehydrogenase family)
MSAITFLPPKPDGLVGRASRSLNQKSTREDIIPFNRTAQEARMRLDGQVALLTGAGRGLGLAFARHLALAGAKVVVNDIDGDVADAAVRDIAAVGGQAAAVVAPIGSSAAAELCVQGAVDAFGRLDIVVCCAGILRDKVLWNMSDDDFDLVVETHMRGTFTVARAAVRRMREQGSGGRLILISSLAGQRGNFGQTNYAAAKAGIAAFTRTWALECARSGITVNAVLPTALTRMVATIPGMEEHFAAAERGEPIPAKLRQAGIGTADDAAPLVLFLASKAASGVTGQCIGLGGDRLALWSHPAEKRVVLRDGGWSAEAIAETWDATIGAEQETYGLDKLP